MNLMNKLYIKKKTVFSQFFYIFNILKMDMLIYSYCDDIFNVNVCIKSF